MHLGLGKAGRVVRAMAVRARVFPPPPHLPSHQLSYPSYQRKAKAVASSVGGGTWEGGSGQVRREEGGEGEGEERGGGGGRQGGRDGGRAVCGGGGGRLALGSCSSDLSVEEF